MIIPFIALLVSSVVLTRAGYGVHIAAVTFVFALSAVIVKGLEDVQSDSKHSH